MFDRKGQIDLKTVPNKHDYTTGDGQAQFYGSQGPSAGATQSKQWNRLYSFIL